MAYAGMLILNQRASFFILKQREITEIFQVRLALHGPAQINANIPCMS